MVPTLEDLTSGGSYLQRQTCLAYRTIDITSDRDKANTSQGQLKQFKLKRLLTVKFAIAVSGWALGKGMVPIVVHPQPAYFAHS